MKKTRLFILIVFLLTNTIIMAQTPWYQVGNTVGGGNDQDDFGNAVCISDDGKTMIVGSRFEDTNNSNAGKVVVYSYNGTEWVQKGISLYGTNTSDYFGSSVSVSADGKYIAIGAPKNYTTGEVKIYEFDGITWLQKGNVIIADTSKGHFGSSVCIANDGNSVVIGEEMYRADNIGRATIYEFNGTNWVQKGSKLSLPNTGHINIALGTSVSFSNDANTVAVGGATYYGHQGITKIYEFDGTDWKSKGDSIFGTGHSGRSVSLSADGNIVAIGNPWDNYKYRGSALVYYYNGTQWIQKGAKIVSTINYGYFGHSVCLSDDGKDLVIGAPRFESSVDDSVFFGKGFVMYYHFNGIDWEQKGDTIARGIVNSDECGVSVSMSGDGEHIAVGSSQGDNDVNVKSGHARVFKFCNSLNTISPVVCDSYTVPSGDETYYTSGIYQDTISNSCGCDSLITINLTVNANTGVDAITACDSYTWIDNITYTESNNTATHTLTNIHGCDSVVTLNLTLNNSNTGIDVINACNSYTWIDGNTYTSNNNSAIYTLTNSHGCDSVVTLDLSINNNTGVDTITACDSFTWIDGNTYTANNNTATHTLTNSLGCDSLVTLNLTLNNSNTGIDVISTCNSYTWIDGITYTESNNIATYTLTNYHGCDSVVSLDLSINSNHVVDVQTACDSYTWIDGNTYTESNNTATYTLTNHLGCDSVITLNLTINNNSGIDTQIACESFDWIDGNTYTSSNNTATYTLTNSNGCDSIVNLDLTITGLPQIFAVSGGGTYPTGGSGVSVGLSGSEIGVNYKLMLDSIANVSTASGTGSAIDFGLQTIEGIYTVIAENSAIICTSEMYGSATVEAVTSLNDVVASNLIVYPNPCENFIQISTSDIGHIINIKVYNSLGKEVLLKQTNEINFVKINTSELLEGIYFVTVITDNIVYSSKFMKK